MDLRFIPYEDLALRCWPYQFVFKFLEAWSLSLLDGNFVNFFVLAKCTFLTISSLSSFI